MEGADREAVVEILAHRLQLPQWTVVLPPAICSELLLRHALLALDLQIGQHLLVFHTCRDGVSGLGLFTCWVASVLEELPRVVAQAATVKTTSNKLCIKQ